MNSVNKNNSLGTIVALLKKITCIFILSIFICGCLPSFKFPIVDFKNNKIDERLYGMWIRVDPTEDGTNFKDTGEYAFVQILPSKRGIEIVSFSQSAEDAPETMYFSGYPALINGEGYLNFRFYLDADEEYYLIQYKIMDNGLLRIFHVDEKAIRQLIESNKLQGVVEKNGVSVATNKTELVKFLESNNIFDTNNPVYFRFKDIGLSRVK